MNEERLSFVCYPSFLDAIEELPEELQGKAALAIMKLGINGEWSDDEPYIRMMLKLIAPNIKAAKDRYTSAVENGKKGGRPATVDKQKVIALFIQGKAITDIAAECACSESYVRKLTKELRDAKNGKNLGYSANILNKDIDNDSDKDIDTNNNKEEDTSSSAFGKKPFDVMALD